MCGAKKNFTRNSNVLNHVTTWSIRQERTLRYRNLDYIIILLKIVEEPVTFYEVSNETKIWLNFASPKVTIKKEVESYSVPSLVADYGGFLGLSVGFNFLMIWECLVIIFAKMKGRKLFYVV